MKIINRNTPINHFIKLTKIIFEHASKHKNWYRTNKNTLFDLVSITKEIICLEEICKKDLIRLANFAAQMSISDTFNPVNATVKVGTCIFKVNNLKFLYYSHFARAMYRNVYKETNDQALILQEIPPNAFLAVSQFIETEEISIFKEKSIPELIQIYETTSRLMMNSGIVTKLINVINSKVSDMTISSTSAGLLSLKISRQQSDVSNRILSNQTVKSEVTEIDLRNFNDINSEDIRNILNTFQNTGTLQVSFPNYIDRSGWTALFNIATIKDLHLNFQNDQWKVSEKRVFNQALFALKEVADTLQKKSNTCFKIHLHSLKNIDFETLALIHKILSKNIATLDLSSSEISSKQLTEVLEGTESLARLNLSYCKKIDADTLKKITTFCPYINDLSFLNTRNICSETIKSICKASQGISVLNLGWQSSISDDSFTYIANNCKKITELNLTNTNKIQDSDLLMIAKKCKQLSILKLNWCNKLTEASLQYLTEHSNSLRSLSLTGAIKRNNIPTDEIFEALFASRNAPFELIISDRILPLEKIEMYQKKYPLITIVVNNR
ncbi:MAG: hypothetical protein VX777_06725 [Chlamydiota bacterium]|nr:hypothetical protein [Chlamydiota bacterium]